MADKGPGTIVVRVLIAVMVLGLGVVYFFPHLVPRPDYVDVENEYSTPPDGARRVIFVGNSHTYRHDVPHIVQKLVPASAPPLAFTPLLSPGKLLGWHAEKGDVAERSTDADFVVIQPQSTELIRGPERARRDAERIAAQARGATPIFFQTWPRHPERDEYARRRGMTIDEWNEETRENSRAIGMRVAPIGDAWVCTYQNTRLDLWSSDGNHSSIAGAYVTALVLYRTLYGSDVAWSDYSPPGLPANIAKTLRRAVAKCLG